MLKFKFGEFKISGLVCSGNTVNVIKPPKTIDVKCDTILEAND
jgi:hypothetical protein